MGRLSERLLPVLMAVIAGLVLAIGIRGFRAERPSFLRLPGTDNTILVTEASAPTIRVTLADGTALLLARGGPAQEVAAFLASDEPAPANFPLYTDRRGGRMPPARAIKDIATVLNAYPQAQVAIRGAAPSAADLVTQLETAGVAAGRIGVVAPDQAQPNAAPLELVVSTR